VRFDGIIRVNKAAKLNLPVGAVFKIGLVMPHLQESPDGAFGFAVGLWSIDLSEFLADTEYFAGIDESMTVSAIIRISVIDVVGALGNDGLGEEAGCAVLGFIGQNGCIEFSGEVVNRDKQVFLGWVGDWPLNKGRRLVSKCTSSPG
jgi:hypothetical protein